MVRRCKIPITSVRWIGVHEAKFRVDDCRNGIEFGVVSLGTISRAGRVSVFFRFNIATCTGGWYGSGDIVTVRLDLDASTVAVRKKSV